MKKRVVTLALVAILLLAVVLTGCSKANDSYPNSPIQVIVPLKAGGDTDANARLMAQYMEKELGVSMPIVNVAGSSGTIGMEQVKSAEADGYTCLFFHTEAMLPEISGLVDYQLDAFKMGGVCLKANTTLLVTHKDAPFQTLNEFIDYAKSKPGEVEFGMLVGGYPQLVGLALEQEAGIDLNLVDIGGNADKIAALAGQNTDVINVEYALVKDYLATGEFVPLALLSEDRNELFNDIPTAKEQGLDLQFGKFFFVAFPKETPDEVVNTFTTALEKVVADPAFVKAAQDSYALTPTYMNPEQATAYAAEVYDTLNLYKDLFVG